MKKFDTTFVTIGATNHNKVTKRDEHDYYSTDEIAITLLDKHGLLDKNVLYWETACGGGRLSEELIRLGYDVISSDKYNHGYGHIGVDFFKCNGIFNGNTITNPPFKEMNEWIVHTLEITSNKAYIFGRIQTIESIGRWEMIFKKNPPSLICPFVKRVQCYKNNEPTMKSPMCYAWFIWDMKDSDNETKVKWLI